ncbi:hypothetical protein CAEBREN_14474 [Caenorhabditis brenneri]|uniref:Uncharacterized protein n=1 Tax=Caenorhabditis brenneri TaxID=135651 RepID=G0N6C5_CAEBE|nr:hypothetical protein CAEBREN_14474 [Caenorhabditis brenneri]
MNMRIIVNSTTWDFHLQKFSNVFYSLFSMALSTLASTSIESELMERCQSARDLMEQNYYQAQTQVLKLKHHCILIEKVDPDAIGFEKKNQRNSCWSS